MAEKMDSRFSYYQRLETMPIPPIKENMEMFRIGDIAIGVEYRVLTGAVLDALGLSEQAAENGLSQLNDNGVSLHVFVKTEEGDYERLRFDCFGDLPHYHYFSMTKKVQDTVYIDPNQTGDTVTWALDVIRRRLPQMLARADVENAAQLVDVVALDQILPLLTASAYRARYQTDAERMAEIEKEAAAVGPISSETDRSWKQHSQA